MLSSNAKERLNSVSILRLDERRAESGERSHVFFFRRNVPSWELIGKWL
jgi:hypothetical protein